VKDSMTLDIFDISTHQEPEDEDEDEYSEMIIAYNKKLNRRHTDESVYFADSYAVFHHV
jgi:hypothetical protein